MIIGILSDTHGDVGITRRAVEVLLGRQAAFLVHCGDLGDDAVIDHLAGTPAAFVFGNNDFDRACTATYAQHLGVECLNDFGTLELAGRRLAVTHGDNPTLMRRLLGGAEADYVLSGHTHKPHDRRLGNTRAINPGALFRARPKTVATLDLTTDELNLIEVA